MFAYPGPDFATRCALACAKDVLDREMNDFVGAFPEMIKRKYVDTIFVVSDKMLTPTAENAWQLGRHLVLNIVSKGTAERSDFYLYYLHGFRIKLRASYVADSSRVHGVEEFAQIVVPAMLTPPPPPVAQRYSNSASTERPIGVSVTVSGHQPDVFADSPAPSRSRVTPSPSRARPTEGSPGGRFYQDRDREPLSDRCRLEGCEDRESTAGHERDSLRWCADGG